MSAQIPLTKGYFALVDDEDLPLVAGYKWFVHEKRSNGKVDGRLERYARTTPKDRKQLSMHRLITNANPGQEIDHINGNTLDNRRSNLRLCTRGQNSMNSQKQMTWKGRPVSSQHKGVCYDPVNRRKKWRAGIRFNGCRKTLGHFATELEAAEAYNAAAKQLHGEFAFVNRPTAA